MLALMNLLPRTHQEFSEKEFWNSFFTQRGVRPFEWYGEYPELCGLLHKYIKSKDNTLVIGCGNSSLSANLYDVGYRNITNIDISHVVIRQMTDTHQTARPGMRFLQMNATDMTFEDGEFSAVLDKGTLDALMPDNTEETKTRIRKLFSEVDRVLRVGGRYVCVSLLQEHILRMLLEFFPSLGWMLRVCRCWDAERKTGDDVAKPTLPVFVVVCTKFKKLPNVPSVLEINLSGEKVQRVSSVEELVSVVKTLQQSSLMLSRLCKGNVSAEGEASLELHSASEDCTRYTVHVLDKPGRHSADRTFAAFIVPEGRESEWLFGTPEGRRALLDTAGYDRLAVVSLHRDQKYEGLEEVKQELAESIMLLAPRNIPASFKVPYLSVGSDVGHREVLYKGCSSMSGEYVVEEVEGIGGHMFRRLIFLGNLSTIQSEAKLKILKIKGKTKKIIDKGHLACEHHKYMSIGISSVILQDDEAGEVLVIGLGGGGLCSFLQQCFTKLKITAVDIDPDILEVATKYFSLVCDHRLNVHIADGLSYIREKAGSGASFAAVLFDVDNKTPGTSMSCPPEEFLDLEILECVKQMIGNRGVFVLNLVCRSPELRKVKLVELKKVFPFLLSYRIEDEVNEIIFCRTQEVNREVMKNAAQQLSNVARKKRLVGEEFIDITEFASSLKVVAL